MDSHGEYSPLDRSRLLRSGLDGGGSSGGIGISSSGACGNLATSVSEVIGRAATPTTFSLAQYHNRFGLPSAVPGSNLAVMSSLFGGAHGTDARKALLIDFQQYWSAHAESFPRYLMTGALYPPYTPLIPGTAESLSLLGAGVACMSGGASNGAGPSQSPHVAHYQRLLEMQKEAYLASLSAAATHHTALYGINATALPPFLDSTPCSSHGITPFSLVKQEPRELSYPEKTPKQTERRTGGFKLDLDLNRGSKEMQTSLSSSLGDPQNTQKKDVKLSPSITNAASTKLVKKGSSSIASSNSNSHQHVHKSTAHSATSSSSTRHNSETIRSKCISPSCKQVSQSAALPRSTVNLGSKKSVSKPSPSACKQVKSTSLGHTSSTTSNASLPSSSTVLRSEPAVMSVPTQASAPIPLATVQHDGVVLSALASPSSAAASLASTKPAVLKQQMDKVNRALSADKEHHDNGKSVSEANISHGLSIASVNSELSTLGSQLSGDENWPVNPGVNNTSDAANIDKDKPAVLCDDGSDIIVDSTENYDYPDTARSPSKSDHERAIEETIEKVASGGDSFTESDPEAVASPQVVKASTEASMTSTLLSVSRTGGSCVTTSPGTSSSTRTVYAKTQPVPSVTVSGCVQLSSSITTLASSSALPYYHTLYSKPQGLKRVHATTFVPEVGVFKGPSIKTARKTSSSPSSSGTMVLSPEARSKLDPRLVLNIQSLSSDGHFRVRDSTLSPSLWSPSRDLSAQSAHSLSASPGIAHTTTEISSSLDSASLDSASVRSQSVASFRSVPEMDGLDDTSDEVESDAAVDHNTYNNCEQSKSDHPVNHTDCNTEFAEPGDSEDYDDDDNGEEEEDDDDETLTKENDSVLDEEDYFGVTTTPDNSGKEFMPINDGKKEEMYDSPITVVSSVKPLVSVDSRVSLVPSELSDKLCCDTAIDYSLPKLSGAVSSSPPHTSCSVNYSLPSSCTKVMSSATRSSNRHDSAALLGESFLCNPSSSHKRLKRNPDYFKLQAITQQSQDIVSKVRRLKQLEDGTVKRCESAPPITSSRPLAKNVKPSVLAAPSVSGEREFLAQEKPDSCNEHGVGNNIPVGIAVAQIRPHHIQLPKEAQTSGNLSRDIRHARSSDTSKNIAQEGTAMAPIAAAVAPSLMVTGHSVNPSPWLPQVPFHIHPAMNSSGATFDPSFPITAPRGYKFAHDSLTGQFFIVPTGEFAEQGGVWPAASFPPPAASGARFQTNISFPAITVSGPEAKSGRLKPERNNTGRHVVSGNTLDSVISDQDVITKDTAGIAKGYCSTIEQADPDGSSTSTLKSVTGNTTAATVTSVTSLTSVTQPVVLKVEPVLEDRGCSPVVFEDTSASLSSSSQHQTLKNVNSCTVETQTCNELMKSSFTEKKSSLSKLSLQDQAIQASFPDISTLNPLSVQCPDLDSVDVFMQPHEVKTNIERASYNPFTDPQILQAADGLELLSTLAEKRTKCSSFDDPKRIFPSPSDSFKSDCASIVAIEETLSPEDTELKSGQCTPRRDIRRDLSPKWSIPKKDPQTSSVFANFKAPTDIEIPEESEMRVRLAEVRRQYKEKQKELAKLRRKKSEEIKPSKRGPGRPPKKKLHNKSSSSSSKTKDHHQPLKKKRPAEELVDRVFRKLPPVIKSSKVSRSIHYVKSKTGPFFRRKSASSSVKRNKDLFGFDESTWPSFSERKHQEKIKATGSFSGKSKCRHRSGLGHGGSSNRHDHDTGNIFTNLESFSDNYIKRREKAFKHQSHKQKKHLYRSGRTAIKSETRSLTCNQESGLGLLVKFALTVSTTSQSSSSVSLSLSSLTAASSSSASARDSQSSIGCFNSGVFSTCISNSANYCSSLYSSCSNLYNISGNTGNGSQAPGVTFGSLSSLMSSPSSGPISFTSPSLTAGSHNCGTEPPKSISKFAAASSPSSVIASPSTSMYTASPLFPSPGAQHSSTEESSSGLSSGTTNPSSGNTSSSTSGSINTGGTTSSVRDISPFKKKHDDDSDTDASDTSPSKKRKPGRPRKINPEKSSVGTETIWAKKSNTIGLHQEAVCSQTKDGIRKLDSYNSLFPDEEWTLRRSERIFLNEPSPLPSPSLSPSPRGEPVWKLSNFMPKGKKVLDLNKSVKESDKDMGKPISSKDPMSWSSSKISTVSSPTVSSSLAVKAEERDFASTVSSVSWTAPHKAVEPSVSKLDDAKLVVKLEDTIKSASSLSHSSSHKSRKTYEDVADSKKKSKKKIRKKEMLPSKSTLLLSPTALEKKVKRAEEHSKIKLQKAKSLHDLTQRVKKKYSKSCIKKRKDDQDSKSRKKKRKLGSDSSDSVNLVSVVPRENPITSEPRSCKLQQSDLREGLKVLYLIDGLFHEGTVKALQPPDVYGVLTAGQRGNRPHILCLEEILKWAVLDMKPESVRSVSEGTRVCAFWSQQFSCLYPGTVGKSKPMYNGNKTVIPVEFDDGDNGKIELDHIRLLPPEFPIVEYEPDPLEVLPKRKQRSSDASYLRKSMETESTSKQFESDEDNDEDESESKTDADSEDLGVITTFEAWKWDGKGVKRIGPKGKSKKVFYKAVTRGSETIRVSDSAVFVSKDGSQCPYIGRIESLWESFNGQRMVKVSWYYHPEETHSNKKLSDPKNALFESQHVDENDIQTIAYKCEVVPYPLFKRRASDAAKKGEPLGDHVFYLAGFYDPSAKNITFYNGVS